MTNSPLFLKAKVRIEDFLSLPKTRAFCLALIIFLIPTQLAKHFWPASAFIYGIRIDYLAPSIYFIDILIFLYLLLFKRSQLPSWTKYLTPFLLILLINLVFSLNPLATLFYSIRLVLYLTFISTLDANKDKTLILSSLSLAIIFQVALGTAQILSGSALQGPLYWLGERSLNVGTPNAARTVVNSVSLLRAYGTFSHPNVLAGWLVAALYIRLRCKSKSPKTIIVAIALIGILLTQSRVAILVAALIIIPLVLPIKKKLFYYLFLALSLIIFKTSSGQLFLRPQSALTERLTLQTLSLKIIAKYPVFGTGLNASLSAYPSLAPAIRKLQPDHNSISLLFSQLGIFGIFSLSLLFKRVKKPSNKLLYLILLPLIITDHFFITSTQGLLTLLLLWKMENHVQV